MQREGQPDADNRQVRRSLTPIILGNFPGQLPSRRFYAAMLATSQESVLDQTSWVKK
jgi:hypothetical protein